MTITLAMCAFERMDASAKFAEVVKFCLVLDELNAFG